MKKKLCECNPNSKVVKYLFRESVNNYMGAVDSLKQKNLYTSFTLLNHCLTYLLFSQWYLGGNKPASLIHLLEKTNSIKIKKHFEERSFMKTKLDEENVQGYINLWEDILTSSMSLF